MRMADKELLEIISAAAQNSSGSFEKLYNLTVSDAVGFAYLYLKKTEDVEDAVQQAFIYVYRYIGDLKNPESYYAWMHTIVRHECQKIINANIKSDKIFDAVAECESCREAMPDLPQTFDESSDLYILVRDTVEELTDEQRMVIVMYFYDNLKIHEISSQLQIPVGTVKSRLHNSKKILKKKLEKSCREYKAYSFTAVSAALTYILLKSQSSHITAASSAGIYSAVTEAAGSAAAAAQVTAASSAAAASSAGGAAAKIAMATVPQKIAAGVAAAVVVTGSVAGTTAAVKNKNSVTAQPETSVAEQSSTLIYNSGYDDFTQIVYETSVMDDGEVTVISEVAVNSTADAAHTNAKVLAGQAGKTEAGGAGDETQQSESEKSQKKCSVSYNKNGGSGSFRNEYVKVGGTYTVSGKSPSKAGWKFKGWLSDADKKIYNPGDEFTVTKATVLTAQWEEEEESTTAAENTAQQTTEASAASKATTTVHSTAQETTAAAKTTQSDNSADFSVQSGNITGYTGSSTSVAIPSSINGTAITGIAAHAFDGNTKIKSVSLPSSVTSIGQFAFNGCTSLTSVSLPSGLKSIGMQAFSQCESLKSITIPSGVTSIGDSAFDSCSSLTSVKIPASVTSIGDGAFDNCPTSLTIKCKENSAAYDYAVDNGIKYELV